MKLPKDMKDYQLEGFTLRPLTRTDVPQMLALQDLVMKALPDPRWYYPSEEWEFTDVVDGQEGFGFFQGERLCGFAELTPGEKRVSFGYAAALNQPAEGSYDFHDVMVHPDMRGRGMHTRFLRLFAQMAKDEGARVIYATVDPENEPSWHNFEKSGYALVLEKPAYDGRMRRYYQLEL